MCVTIYLSNELLLAVISMGDRALVLPPVVGGTRLSVVLRTTDDGRWCFMEWWPFQFHSIGGVPAAALVASGAICSFSRGSRTIWLHDRPTHSKVSSLKHYANLGNVYILPPGVLKPTLWASLSWGNKRVVKSGQTRQRPRHHILQH